MMYMMNMVFGGRVPTERAKKARLLQSVNMLSNWLPWGLSRLADDTSIEHIQIDERSP